MMSEFLICLTVIFFSMFAVYDYGFQRRYIMALSVSIGVSPFALYAGLLFKQLGLY